MIKIEIIAIGKDKDKWVTEGIQHYTKLIKKYAQIKWNIIPNLKDSSNLTPKETKQKESELIKRKINNRKYIALTDIGDEFDSVDFSKRLNKLLTNHNSRLIIVIGGAYGLAENILRESSSTMSLSKLTFSHQLVRLVLMEQLFRAFSILNHTDYHK